MPFTVKDNSSKLNSDMMLRGSIFLRTMADEIIKISTPKTPKKSGRLRMDITRSVLGLSGRIKWGKNYAAIQETTQFENYSTPGTGPHFAENAVQAGMERSRSVMKRVGFI